MGRLEIGLGLCAAMTELRVGAGARMREVGLEATALAITRGGWLIAAFVLKLAVGDV